MLTLIVARATNGAIGRRGDIPWSAPEDLKVFQRETVGGAVVMGRRTWESLPVRPLRNRFNCVVTRSDIEADLTSSNPGDAVKECYAAGYTRIYGIGGQSIYAALLPIADRLMITEVDIWIEDADAFFPEFDATEWKLKRSPVIRESSPRCVLHEFIRA
jgi:dihydrofolate reductase